MPNERAAAGGDYESYYPHSNKAHQKLSGRLRQCKSLGFTCSHRVHTWEHRGRVFKKGTSCFMSKAECPFSSKSNHLMWCRRLPSHSQNNIEVRVCCAIIARMLTSMWTGRKPTLRTHEIIWWHFYGMTDDEELLAHLKRRQRRFTARVHPGHASRCVRKPRTENRELMHPTPRKNEPKSSIDTGSQDGCRTALRMPISTPHLFGFFVFLSPGRQVTSPELG